MQLAISHFRNLQKQPCLTKALNFKPACRAIIAQSKQNNPYRIFNHQAGVVWPAGRTNGLAINLNLVVEGNQRLAKIVQRHNKIITAVGAAYDAPYLPFLNTFHQQD